MRMSVKQQTGVSLLELLLVLAIASSIALLGIRMYQRYQVDQDAERLLYTVNTLFLGMSRYYQANCRSGPIPQAIDIYTLQSENFITKIVEQKEINVKDVIENMKVNKEVFNYFLSQ